jgi:hypothetical protein
MVNQYPCPCCGYLTLDEKPPGTYEICKVCFWEDDNVQFDDPSFEGGANEESLIQARANFMSFGASSRKDLPFVRAPLPNETPQVHWAEREASA